MGELINLRRVKKAAEQAAKRKAAATSRATYGTPKHQRKVSKAEKRRGDKKIEAHRLDSKMPWSQ